MKHALLNTSNELQRVQDFTDTPPALPEAKGLRWLEYVDTPQPAFDPMTQQVESSAPMVADKYTTAWSVTDLPGAVIVAKQLQAAQELQQSIVTAIQARLDTFAQTRNYDGILSAATYASSTVPKFAAEGQCAVNMRDSTWATLYTLLAEIQAGTRPVPTSYADIEPLLPALVWPA